MDCDFCVYECIDSLVYCIIVLVVQCVQFLFKHLRNCRISTCILLHLRIHLRVHLRIHLLVLLLLLLHLRLLHHLLLSPSTLTHWLRLHLLHSRIVGWWILDQLLACRYHCSKRVWGIPVLVIIGLYLHGLVVNVGDCLEGLSCKLHVQIDHWCFIRERWWKNDLQRVLGPNLWNWHAAFEYKEVSSWLARDRCRISRSAKDFNLILHLLKRSQKTLNAGNVWMNIWHCWLTCILKRSKRDWSRLLILSNVLTYWY